MQEDMQYDKIYFICSTFPCDCRSSACGGTITQNSTHIQNPGYPEGYTDSTSCVYTFKVPMLSTVSNLHKV